MKKIKIICTIGPATIEKQRLEKLVKHGMNVARINTSHGNKKQWTAIINNLRSICDLPIIMDLTGPEIRYVSDKDLRVKKGKELELSIKDFNIKNFKHIKKGGKAVINEGLIKARIKSVSNSKIIIKFLNQGVIKKNSKFSIPSAHDKLPILSEHDKETLKIINKEKIEYIALSYTRNSIDIKEARKELINKTKIIAKIESKLGVINHKDIIKSCDAVMIARGDLGVGMRLSKVPLIQKRIINACNELGKPVIVATQILESMIRNKLPTRAEVSDAANAILDGADALMLSGETAIGKHPELCIKVLSEVDKDARFKVNPVIKNSAAKSISDVVTGAVQKIVSEFPITKIITITRSGYSARMISRFKPRAEIIAFTNNTLTRKELELSYGVTPILMTSGALDIINCARKAFKKGLLFKDDIILFAGGFNVKGEGVTNMIQIHEGKSLHKICFN